MPEAEYPSEKAGWLRYLWTHYKRRESLIFNQDGRDICEFAEDRSKSKCHTKKFVKTFSECISELY